MSDSAKGSISGYLYQFDRAFFLLCDITEDEGFISLERVDDVSVHSEEGTILIVEKDKNSIAESGTTFKDTSKDLWRTIELWIQKIKEKTLNSSTKFQCSTNKIIPNNALVKFMFQNKDSFELVKDKIQEIRKIQEEKLNNYKIKDNKRGKHVQKILSLIDYAIVNEAELKIIVSNLFVYDNTNLKREIISKLRISSYSELQQETIYNNLYGWMVNICKYKWNNDLHAEISKRDFDYQYKLNLTSPSIINAIFRAKKDISIDDIDFESKKDEIFVKQINILNTGEEAKKFYVRKAIEDFLRYEIEQTYIIGKGNILKEDFMEFLNVCLDKWKDYFYSLVTKEIEDYTDKEMNDLGIKVYNHIINDLQVHFKNDISFNTDNMYIKNGSFLKLSNIPEIGWHPNWKNLISTSNE